MALFVFAFTLFVSAFLLFMVQPMVGKMLLPPLGGTPQVWNTCCVFFQCALLAGYGYTHTVSSKMTVRRQLIFHGVILVLPLLVLFLPLLLSTTADKPFDITTFTPPPGGNPIPATLLVLTLAVAVPFIVVATSAPLLQRWFANTGHPAASDPYFLYGASNLGSMLALISYPFLVEPFLSLKEQAFTWAIAYVLLAIMIGVCAYFVFKAPPTVQLAGGPSGIESEPKPAPAAPKPSTQIKASPAPAAPKVTGIRRGAKQRGRPPVRDVERPRAHQPAAAPVRPFAMTWWKRLRWVMLGAVPCSMMLGVTTYMSTDISAFPLFWVFPLSLYLLSFILVFIKWPVVWSTPETRPIPGVVQFGLLALVVFNVLAYAVFPEDMLRVVIGFMIGSIIAVFAGLAFAPKLIPNYSWNGVPHHTMLVIHPFALMLLAFVVLTHAVFPVWRTAGFCLFGFFLTAMACHGELARDRPPTRYLTEFFLWMSVGGAVGGFFNAILAPQLFTGPYELPLAIVVGALVRPVLGGMPWTQRFLKAILPEATMRGIEDAGDDLARRMQKTETPEGKEAPATPEDLPPKGYLLNIALDIMIGLIIFGLALYLRNFGPRWRGTFADFGQKWLGIKDRRSLSLFVQMAQNAVVFGIPMLFALVCFARPLRFGLALGGILLATTIYENQADYRGGQRLLRADRSYFGILKVYETEDEDGGHTYTNLHHGTTHHGLNYQDEKRPDLRRLATTYYHRFGPVGIVMERLNWFPGVEATTARDRFTYEADKRLPASVVGLGAANVGGGILPLPQLVAAWSEPPYACVGLGTGTMASYARPFQHMTFYEIDDKIRSFSLPEDPAKPYLQYLKEVLPDEEAVARRALQPNYLNYVKEAKSRGVVLKPYYNYIVDALERGANIEVIMGDARLSLKREDPTLSKMSPHRDKYYRVIELDAFSSDAIPVHLITKEAIQLYLKKLSKEGVLMVHTSNRHLNLVTPVTRVSQELGIKYRVGKDQFDRQEGLGKESNRGRFGSEYVMLAREEDHLPRSTPWQAKQGPPTLFWYTPTPPSDFRVWTDDYSGMVSVLRWGIDDERERPVPDNPLLPEEKK